MNLVHDIADSWHDSGTQCEFCLKFSRTGFALNSELGQPALFWRLDYQPQTAPAIAPQSGPLLSPESRGPPA
jgi:hypothetical protein